MKLGASIACYRWMLDAHRRRDRPEHRTFGWRPAFLQSASPPPVDAPRWEWMLEKVVELGLEGFYFHPVELGDEATARAFGAEMRAHGLTFNGGLGVNWAATADEWDGHDHAYAREQIEMNAIAGSSIATTTHLRAPDHNHFSTDPPIERQIDRAIRNFRTLLPMCAEAGVTLALENHMDYRLTEVAAIVEGVGSPWMKITLDTANSFLVLEDPLEGAHRAAPHTVVVHLKDFSSHPLTETWEPEFHWAPVGRGDSPIAEILDLLEAEAPDPDSLLAQIETGPPPHQDPDQWLRAGIAHVRTTASDHFPNQAT